MSGIANGLWRRIKTIFARHRCCKRQGFEKQENKRRLLFKLFLFFLRLFKRRLNAGRSIRFILGDVYAAIIKKIRGEERRGLGDD